MYYDHENIKFVKVSAPYSFGMALTGEGELYVWGKNENDQFGLEEKVIYSPTKIPFFDDYIVVDFSCGEQHAVVQAKSKVDQTNIEIFLIDDITKMSEIKNGEKVKWLKKFSNKEIEFFLASRCCSFIKIYPRNDFWSVHEKSILHQGYLWEVTKEHIWGTMHFWRSDDKWHFVSEAGYNQIKDQLPPM